MATHCNGHLIVFFLVFFVVEQSAIHHEEPYFADCTD